MVAAMAERLEEKRAAESVTGEKEAPIAAGSSFSLPVDLVVEILTRLPVKSLIRFSCVDKTWYAIIKSPSFIYAHARNYNSNNFMSWVDHNFRIGVFSPDDYLSKFPHGLYEILLPFNLRKTFGPVEIGGYCHGIFCVYWWSLSDNDNGMPIFALCNPATKEFRVLPESRLGLPPYKMLEEVNAGFGFDPKANGYKVIKLVNFVGNEDRIDAVEIYSLRNDSWKTIDAFQHNLQIYGIDCFGKHTNDGFYHWFLYQYDDDDDGDDDGGGGGDDDDDDDIFLRYRGHEYAYAYANAILVLVSFDMGNEVFRVTQLPVKYTSLRKKPSTKRYVGYSVSLLHDEKLTIIFSFCEKEGTTTFEIYELEGDSWSHVFSVEPVPYYYCTLGFWKTNELLVLRGLPGPCWDYVSSPYEIYSAEQYELIREGYPFLYNIVTKQSRDLYQSREVNHIYKESLVSIKGACES